METLPSEIITQIMEYLPFDDRREMAMVNKLFYYASSHPVFLRKELLIYQPLEVNLNHFKQFKNMLLKSKRRLLCLKFVDLTLNDLTIFTKTDNRITSLHFNNLKSLDDSFLDAITQCCSNLEELEFKDLIDFFLTDKDREPILKLHSISLDKVQISDREFNLILKLAPNLKHLSILDSRLIGGSQVVKRFYPHNNIECSSLFNKYDSNFILSEKNIVHHLNNSVRLNSLRLNQYCNIFYLIQPIQLEFKSLALDLMETINNQSMDFEKLNLVLSQYVSLEQLEICYLPVDLLSIVSKLYDLRHLTLSYSGTKSNSFNGVESLKSFMKSLINLKYIRTLSFNRVFENDDVLLPILPFSACTLKSLTSLDCSLDNDLSVLKCGQKLTSLHIRNGDVLKAKDLELLFRNLTKLKHLWIDKCSVLNDEIFIKLPISNLKSKELLKKMLMLFANHIFILSDLITLKIMQSNISHHCLQYITNSSLKVLILTNVSFEPCSTLSELRSFEVSAYNLSQAVPMLTHLEVCINLTSRRAIESLDLLTYFQTNFKMINFPSMNEEMEKCVLQNIPWANLPATVKQGVGNSLKEYKKCISVYSIRNQVRYKTNLVRTVVRNEQNYYEDLMTYSRENLMLYPYHLSDVIVKGLRITPFQFYISTIIHVMESDKSYDSIPNFTAVDCLRILGIGRNEYIELMNQCRTKNKLFRKKNEIRPMLPSQPIDINADPWWTVDVGCLFEDDIKTINEDEKKFIDHIIDNGQQMAGSLDYNILHSLYKKGLIYYDVPIYDDDHIIVSTLGGFVMNRVLGDNFENLLYKIFVSIDEHTSVSELATVLEIDLESVKNAVSLFCRLKIAQKKSPKTFSTHLSWSGSKNIPKLETVNVENVSDLSSSILLPTETPDVLESSPDKSNAEKRMAFLFDSTLTAFLMMGNLSPSLKDHAVTLFEAGKLTDEALDVFLDELDKVADGYSAGSCVFGSETPSAGESEGEARRYFEHALTLRSTVKALRSENCSGKLDLIRWESLKSLTADTCVRFLKKNYNLLMSMAPLNKETPLLSSPKLPHIGPPIPEVNSVWFKLYLYHKTCYGPPSLLLIRGVRLWNVPKIFRHCSKVMITTWGHDPHFIPIENLLTIINDTLKESPVLIQACNPNTCVLPFPKMNHLQNEHSFLYEEDFLKSLSNVLNIKNTCGYITCVTTPTKYEKKLTSEQPSDASPVFQKNGVSLLKEELEKLNDASSIKKTLLLEPVYDTSKWTLLDCCFGVPLFNSDVNQNICKYIVDNQMWNKENVMKLVESNELLSKDLLDFIESYKDSDKDFEDLLPFDKSSIAWPVDCLIFENGKLTVWK